MGLRQRISRALAALAPLLGAALSCDGDVVVVGAEPAARGCEVPSYTSPNAIERIDLLLAIDNSRSMADKQEILACGK